jgi:Phytanoyl-CoA dioxygenase (PhyH)
MLEVEDHAAPGTTAPGSAPTGEALDRVVAQARGLAEAGQYRQALDLLSAQAAASLDPITLRDMVLWRHAAFDPQGGQASWPKICADPFPGVAEPPEIQVSELSAEVLAGAIQHHGCLLVRGLITPEQTVQLTQVVRNAFDAARAVLSGGQEPQVSPWFTPYPSDEGDHDRTFGRAFGWQAGGVWTADSPRALADFIAFLRAHNVTRVIEDYLGEPSYLSLGKSTLRVVKPGTNADWHQDGSFLGPDIRTVNVWLALSDCGEHATGLDILPRRLNGLVETGTRGAAFDWCVGKGVIEDMSRETPVLTPAFKAGDALLFDQLFLHRTSGAPNVTLDRLAIESWFFAGSTFPMDQVPLAI